MGHNSSTAAQTVELLWGLTSQLIQKIQERRGNINIVAYCILCYNKIALERESERERDRSPNHRSTYFFLASTVQSVSMGSFPDGRMNQIQTT